MGVNTHRISKFEQLVLEAYQFQDLIPSLSLSLSLSLPLPIVVVKSPMQADPTGVNC